MLLALAETTVADGERCVLERREIRCLADHRHRFVQILEVDAGRELVPPGAGHRQGVVELQAQRMALAGHVGLSAGHHVAVGTVAGEFQHPVRAAKRQAIGRREHVGLVQILRRGEEGERRAVVMLPEVVVADAERAAQRLGIHAVIVVDGGAVTPGRCVIDLQFDIHAAVGTRLHQWNHLALAVAVERAQLRLCLGEVRHRAGLQCRHALAQTIGIVVLGTHHGDLADARLAHLQDHHAAADLLFGQLDIHRLVALALVGRLQRQARRLHVLQRAIGAEVRRDRALYLAGLQHGIAAYQVFVDLDARRRCGRSRLILRGRQRYHAHQAHRQGHPGPCLGSEGHQLRLDTEEGGRWQWRYRHCRFAAGVAMRARCSAVSSPMPTTCTTLSGS
ncbi:hypothetical protein D3C72_962290 [compost metagenome]